MTHGPYEAYGLHITSDFELPELIQAQVTDSLPSIALRRSQQREKKLQGRTHIYRSNDGLLTIHLNKWNFFEVDPEAKTVFLTAEDGSDASFLRTHFYGKVSAALCMKHSVLPLHASCVQIGDKAWAIAGASGAGKSTLTAALYAEGHGLIADDLCAVHDAIGEPHVWPGPARLRMMPETLMFLGHKNPPQEQWSAPEGKFMVPFQPAAGPVHFGGVFLISAHSASTLEAVRLRGAECTLKVMEHVHSLPVAHALDVQGHLLSQSIRLAERTHIYKVHRRRDGADLSETVQLLERLAEA